MFLIDDIDEKRVVSALEVQEKAALLVDRSFAKYKKFEKLSSRIKVFFQLQADGGVGKQKMWIEKS